MNFWEIASIVFVCTAANHLGPIPDIEAFIRRKLPVIGCVKCLAFWAVSIYCFGRTETGELPKVLAISFLSAWSAIWLDLMMGMIDKLYLKIYDALYSATDEVDADTLGADDSLSDVPDTEEGGEEGCDGIADGTNEETDNP